MELVFNTRLAVSNPWSRRCLCTRGAGWWRLGQHMLGCCVTCLDLIGCSSQRFWCSLPSGWCIRHPKLLMAGAVAPCQHLQAPGSMAKRLCQVGALPLLGREHTLSGLRAEIKRVWVGWRGGTPAHRPHTLHTHTHKNRRSVAATSWLPSQQGTGTAAAALAATGTCCSRAQPSF